MICEGMNRDIISFGLCQCSKLERGENLCNLGHSDHVAIQIYRMLVGIYLSWETSYYLNKNQ